jgi:hypothetical protein
MAFEGVRIRRVTDPGCSDQAVINAWLSDFTTRATAAYNENAESPLPPGVDAFTPQWDFPVDGHAGVACAILTEYKNVFVAGDPGIEPTVPEGWGVDPENPLG